MKRTVILLVALLSAACSVPTSSGQSDLAEEHAKGDAPMQATVSCITHADFDVVCSGIPSSTTSDSCEDNVALAECDNETKQGVNGDCDYIWHFARTRVESCSAR
jgi:hypothetical protein